MVRFRELLAGVASRVEALSPLAVLGRGYSVTTDVESGKVRTAADELEIGKLIRTRLKMGSLVSRVEVIEEGPERSKQ